MEKYIKGFITNLKRLFKQLFTFFFYLSRNSRSSAVVGDALRQQCLRGLCDMWINEVGWTIFLRIVSPKAAILFTFSCPDKSLRHIKRKNWVHRFSSCSRLWFCRNLSRREGVSVILWQRDWFWRTFQLKKSSNVEHNRCLVQFGSTNLSFGFKLSQNSFILIKIQNVKVLYWLIRMK